MAKSARRRGVTRLASAAAVAAMALIAACTGGSAPQQAAPPTFRHAANGSLLYPCVQKSPIAPHSPQSQQAITAIHRALYQHWSALDERQVGLARFGGNRRTGCEEISVLHLDRAKARAILAITGPYRVRIENVHRLAVGT